MRYIYMIIAFLILFGCNDTCEYSLDQSKHCLATLNGIEWTGESFLYINPQKNDTMDLAINIFNKQSFLREKLIFFNIPLQVGAYNSMQLIYLFNRYFVTGASYQTFLDDGDVLGEQYYINENSGENWIEVDAISIEANKLILSGSFQLQLFIDSTRGKIFETSPDSIKFKDGLFKAKED